jgi:hypothetical protein
LIAEAVVTDGPITSRRKTVVTADILVKRAPDSRSGKDHLPSEETAELQKAELQEWLEMSLAMIVGLALAVRRAPLPNSQRSWDTHLYRTLLIAGIWVAFSPARCCRG